ncbi:N-acetylmuramoyl-L-alanine amidase LytC precursor [compost metagenome]
MYDFLISLLETIFRHGWSLSSAGAIVFLLLKQRKIKKRLQKYFPWMFSEENDVRAYATNQLIILENQRRIMISLGVEPCVNGPMMKSENQHQKNCSTLLNLLQPVTARVKRLRRTKMKTIVIDAGHGGKDPGAIGTTGTREKDFALTMAKKLADRLKGSEVTAVLTRQNDTFIELSTRAQIANNLKADAFLSIHANSSSTGASGTETFYTRPESKEFAELIHKYLVAATGLKDRKAKVQNLAVTRETTMKAAALVEPGFINHPSDEIKLFDPAFQDKVIEALAQAIFEYFNVKDRPIQDDVEYPEMEITVRAHEDQTFTGYNIKNTTWVPSRPVGELLGASIGYAKGKVTINGNPVETKLINGLGYVTARDLTSIIGARIFWDKAEPHKVDIYKGA